MKKLAPLMKMIASLKKKIALAASSAVLAITSLILFAGPAAAWDQRAWVCSWWKAIC